MTTSSPAKKRSRAKAAAPEVVTVPGADLRIGDRRPQSGGSVLILEELHYLEEGKVHVSYVGEDWEKANRAKKIETRHPIDLDEEVTVLAERPEPLREPAVDIEEADDDDEGSDDVELVEAGDVVEDPDGQIALATGDEPSITNVIIAPRPLKAEFRLKAPKPIAVNRDVQPGAALLFLVHAIAGPVTTGGEVRSHEVLPVTTVEWDTGLEPRLAVNAVLDLETRDQRTRAIIDNALAELAELHENEVFEADVDLRAALRDRMYRKYGVNDDGEEAERGSDPDPGVAEDPDPDAEVEHLDVLRARLAGLQAQIAEAAPGSAAVGELAEEADRVQAEMDAAANSKVEDAELETW